MYLAVLNASFPLPPRLPRATSRLVLLHPSTLNSKATFYVSNSLTTVPGGTGRGMRASDAFDPVFPFPIPIPIPIPFLPLFARTCTLFLDGARVISNLHHRLR